MIAASFSFLLSMYIALRAQAAQATGELSYEVKPTSVTGCNYNFMSKNVTNFEPVPEPDSFQLHHISFYYYSFLGTIVTIVVAFIVSLICGETDTSSVDLKLLAPCMRKFFEENDSTAHNGIKMEVTEHVFEVKNNQLIISEYEYPKKEKNTN